MHDQADMLRQRMRECTSAAPHGPLAPLLVVGGGKGGVGTTTIAANLAVALARQGRRAVFVDADLEHGGHALLAGTGRHGSVADVLAGRCTVHEVLQRGPCGVQVLAGAWASSELSEPSAAAQTRFVAELGQLAPHADVVVIDAGSGRSRFARQLWQAAAAVAVVATTESQAITNAYAAIKALSGSSAPQAVHTLVNLAVDAPAADDVQQRIAVACRRFLAVRAVAAGWTPCCEPDRLADGVLIFPARSAAARAIDRAADTLWAHLQVHAPRGLRTSRPTDHSLQAIA